MPLERRVCYLTRCLNIVISLSATLCFLSTLGLTLALALALRFVRCDQLTVDAPLPDAQKKAAKQGGLLTQTNNNIYPPVPVTPVTPEPSV